MSVIKDDRLMSEKASPEPPFAAAQAAQHETQIKFTTAQCVMARFCASLGYTRQVAVDIADCPIDIDFDVLVQILDVWGRKNPFLGARRSASLDETNGLYWYWSADVSIPLHELSATWREAEYADMTEHPEIAHRLNDFVLNVFYLPATSSGAAANPQLLLVCDELYFDAVARQGVRAELERYISAVSASQSKQKDQAVQQTDQATLLNVAQRLPPSRLMLADAPRRLRAVVKTVDAVRAAEAWSDTLCQVASTASSTALLDEALLDEALLDEASPWHSREAQRAWPQLDVEALTQFLANNDRLWLDLIALLALLDAKTEWEAGHLEAGKKRQAEKASREKASAEKPNADQQCRETCVWVPIRHRVERRARRGGVGSHSDLIANTSSKTDSIGSDLVAVGLLSESLPMVFPMMERMDVWQGLSACSKRLQQLYRIAGFYGDELIDLRETALPFAWSDMLGPVLRVLGAEEPASQAPWGVLPEQGKHGVFLVDLARAELRVYRCVAGQYHADYAYSELWRSAMTRVLDVVVRYAELRDILFPGNDVLHSLSKPSHDYFMLNALPIPIHTTAVPTTATPTAAAQSADENMSAYPSHYDCVSVMLKIQKESNSAGFKVQLWREAINRLSAAQPVLRTQVVYELRHALPVPRLVLLREHASVDFEYSDLSRHVDGPSATAAQLVRDAAHVPIATDRDGVQHRLIKVSENEYGYFLLFLPYLLDARSALNLLEEIGVMYARLSRGAAATPTLIPSDEMQGAFRDRLHRRLTQRFLPTADVRAAGEGLGREVHDESAERLARRPIVETFTLEGEALQAVRHMAHAHCCTVERLILAAWCLLLQKLHPQHPLVMDIVESTPKASDSGSCLGPWDSIHMVQMMEQVSSVDSVPSLLKHCDQRRRVACASPSLHQASGRFRYYPISTGDLDVFPLQGVYAACHSQRDWELHVLDADQALRFILCRFVSNTRQELVSTENAMGASLFAARFLLNRLHGVLIPLSQGVPPHRIAVLLEWEKRFYQQQHSFDLTMARSLEQSVGQSVVREGVSDGCDDDKRDDLDEASLMRRQLFRRICTLALLHPKRPALLSAGSLGGQAQSGALQGAKNQVVSYGDLVARVSHMARGLRAKGVEDGDVLILYAEKPAAIITLCLAVLEAGATWVLVDPYQSKTCVSTQLNDGTVSGWIAEDRL
ncbi:MAG: AMP-binding protein, partial [Gammaproteobacteria bacterium]